MLDKLIPIHPQLAQLVAEQELQELPPPMGVGTPPESLAKDAKEEINLFA